ncbi:hypothetical protein [Parasphingopyxis marina]|uniref:Uncharacterized protein n=1 Tax=Parasphingopyxis marina TaxID=2761622 RepID=A0A842HZQ5_9SPHN|nr:hypothetical protein [Parasphingopyxis marina]MBC2776984.1 hypothetical protein [Parasphingopyxis marina]
MTDEETHLTKNEARAGATPHMTRVVLVVSLLLIVAIFGLLFMFWSG